MSRRAGLGRLARPARRGWSDRPGRRPGPGRDTRSFGKLLVTAVVSAFLPLPWRTGRRDTMGIEHSEETQMEASPSGAPGLKRSLSVWAAVGLSVALMAPSMAANINPQGSALHAGRAVPLTF